jgi:hypothetical protein
MSTTTTEARASPVSAWRAARVLTRLRLRRQWNQIRSASRFRKASPARTGTRRKASLGWLLTAFIALAMIGNFVNLSYQGMANLEKALGTVEVARAVQRSWLGVQFAAVTADIAGRLGVEPPRGVLINNAIDNGPAKMGGLQPQDVVVKFGANDVRDARDLQRLIGSRPVGTNVEIVLIRNGQELRRIIKLSVLPEDARPLVQRIPPAPGSALAPGMLRGAAFLATLLLLGALFIVLASREIAQPEWDLEWLATLPLPLSTLLLSRVVERAVTNWAGLIALAPFLSVVAWQCGYRWGAPLIGAALTFALLFVVAIFQTLVDTGLRLSLSPPKLRNLQAIVSLVAGLPLLLTISIAMPQNALVIGWIAAVPDWIGLLPTGLAVRAVAAADATSAALWSAAMIGQIVALVAVGYALLERQLRHGVVAAGGREAGARQPGGARRMGGAVVGSGRVLLSAVQRRELILLARDRAFMVQTLLLPGNCPA